MWAAILIASVSLIVCGISIMNVLLITINERIREIGVRRAVSLKRIHICLQFLLESAFLTSVRGITGVMLGIIGAKNIGKIFLLPIKIQIWAVLISIIFSSIIGLIFEIYPSIKASNLNPIEALRYE
jgi:putative ABC transport system permease protein